MLSRRKKQIKSKKQRWRSHLPRPKAKILSLLLRRIQQDLSLRLLTLQQFQSLSPAKPAGVKMLKPIPPGAGIRLP
jgi:hypothetical protein